VYHFFALSTSETITATLATQGAPGACFVSPARFEAIPVSEMPVEEKALAGDLRLLGATYHVLPARPRVPIMMK